MANAAQVISDIAGGIFGNEGTRLGSQSPDPAKTEGELIGGLIGTALGYALGGGSITGALVGGVGTFVGGAIGQYAAGGWQNVHLGELTEDAVLGTASGILGGALGSAAAEFISPGISISLPAFTNYVAPAIGAGLLSTAVGIADDGKNALINGISDALSPLVQSTLSGLIAVGQAEIDASQAIAGGVSNLASSLGNAISNGLSAADQAISDGLSAIGQAEIDATQAIADGIGNLASSAENAISNGLSAAEQALSNGLDSAEQALSNGVQALSDGVNAVGQNVSDGLSALGDGLNNLFNNSQTSQPDSATPTGSPDSTYNPAPEAPQYTPPQDPTSTSSPQDPTPDNQSPAPTQDGPTPTPTPDTQQSDGGYGYGPVVLGLTGKGVNITKLTSSNTFRDVTGDGYQNRTAWAGAGSAVLFFDPNNTNAIAQANQIIFTDWDPTAKTDMQALLDVFDTNHDGKLDAGDADFAQFKLMVTNADGTQSVETLAQAGITSIDLSANNVMQTFSDGSSIDGETTYTTAAGTTGTAATVTFGVDPNGYIVQSTTITDATTGAVTVDNKALNADGSLANETISTTTADGLTKTIDYDLNGDGQIDVVQTDDTVVDATGTVETLADATFAGILIDQTVTTTATDATTGVTTVTIDRDANGSVANGVDVISQREVDTTSGGLTTVWVTDLNPDGSVRDQTVTTPSAGGLTDTVQQDVNGDGIFDLTTVTATTVNPATGARTTIVTDYNANGSERDQAITVASVDGQIQTVASDINGNGVIDLTTTSAIVQGTTSSIVTGVTGVTTTIASTAANGAFLNETVSFESNDGLTKVTQTDAQGAGTSDAPVFDLTTTDVTTVDAVTGTRTETVTDTNMDGSLRDQSVTIKGSDGITRTTDVDSTGAVTVGGASIFDQIETIVVDNTGSIVDTTSSYALNGTLVDQAVTTTSADGLTKVVQIDLNGDGVFDLSTTTKTATVSGGGSIVTVVDGSANGAVIGTTTRATSADGLVVTTQSDVGGNTTTMTDATAVNETTGARTETVAVTSANGTLESRIVTVTSADRNNQTISSDLNGDGNVDKVESIIKQTDGSIVNTVSNYATNGTLTSQVITTTSATGLSKTTTSNIDGKVDTTTTDVTVLNTDGSRTETVTQFANDGSQVGQTIVTSSATGLLTTTTSNIDGRIDSTVTDATVLNADGSRTETVTRFDSTGTAINSHAVTTSANGLSVTTQVDENGDGVVDVTQTDVTLINADGSKTETVTAINANGTLRNSSVTTTSANGLNVTVQADTTGDGSFDKITSQSTNANDDVAQNVELLNQDGSLVGSKLTTTSADGLSQTTQTDLNGDGVFDQTTSDVTVINSDGGRTETVTDLIGTTVVQSTVTTASANGLLKTDAITKSGSLQETDTSSLVYNSDGSETLTVIVKNGNGAVQSETVTTTSADQKTTTIQYNSFGSTPFSSTETKIVQADGSLIDTVTQFNGYGQEASQLTTTTAANGLSNVTTTDQNGDGTVDETESDVKTIAADGGQAETFTDSNDALNSITGGFTESATVITTVSANGLSKTVTTTGTNGQGSLDHSSVQATVVNADDSETTTDTETVGLAEDVSVTTSSGNGLTVTKQISTLGNGVYDRSNVMTQNLDGSTTETTTNINADGSAGESETINTSADGRTQAIVDDTVEHGLANNAVTSITPDVNGNSVKVVTNETASGVELSQTTTNVSADGLSTTVMLDTDGDGTIDETRTTVTSLNADGSRSKIFTDAGSDGSIIKQQATTTSADGLSSTIVTTIGGGLFDTLTNITTDNSDGSTTDTTTTTEASGFDTYKTIVTVSADDRTTISTYDVGAADATDEIKTSQTDSSGVTTVTDNFYSSGSTYQAVTTTSADGRDITVATHDSSKPSTDTLETTLVSADGSGSYSWTQQNASGGYLIEADHLVDSNGVDTISLTINGVTTNLVISAAQEAQDLAQAQRIYQIVLNRSMTAAESQEWLKYYTPSGFNALQLASDLIGPSPIASPAVLDLVETSDGTFIGLPESPASVFSNFIGMAYLNYFGRQPDATEVANWGAQLVNGTVTEAALVVELSNIQVNPSTLETVTNASGERIVESEFNGGEAIAGFDSHGSQQYSYQQTRYGSFSIKVLPSGGPGPGPGGPGPGPGGSPGPGGPGPGPGGPGHGSGHGKNPPPPNPRDPLVLNFASGSDLNLTSLTNSSAYFDFTGSGFATQTGWIGANEGILILDNGQGDTTITPDELLGAISGNGFSDLTALDSNGDGIIDASDPAFNQLRVWIDQNGNGQLDPGELKTLSQLGISSISLSTTPSGQSVNGNQIVNQSTFTQNGSVDTISEVDFATNTVATIYTPPADFSYSPEALLLPQLVGYGTLPSLQISMSQDAELLAEVKSLVINAPMMTGAEFDAAFQAMLFEWAGVSAVDPTSRGTYVNAQHLGFLYQFYGIDQTTETAYAVNPNNHSGSIWESDYQIIVDQMEVRFASQVGLSLFALGGDAVALANNPLTVFSEISFDTTTDTISVNLNQLMTSIVNGAPTDPAAAENYYDITFRVVRGLRVDLFNNDNALFTGAVLSELDALGVSSANEAVAFNAFGFVDDRRSEAGQISITSENEVVLLGFSDVSVSGGVNDGYVYAATGGNDTISDTGSSAEVVLEGLSEAGVVFERPNGGSDLLVVNSTTGSTLTISNYFENSTFQSIEFSDGTSLAHSDMETTLRNEAISYLTSATALTDTLSQQQAKLALFGFTSEIDEGAQTGTVSGTSGADVILIGTGDKTVAGGGGADFYVYSSNGGDVIIDDAANLFGGVSNLVFSDIASTGVTLSRPNGGGDLVFTVNSTGNTVTVDGEFFFTGTGSLPSITFADGTSWTLPQIQQMLLDQESAATGGDVYGYYGVPETLVAGLGNKFLEGGGATANTYVYSSAGGNDIISDPNAATGTLQFSDIASTDVTLSRPNGANDLVLTVNSTGNTVTVENEFYFTGAGSLAAITFSDGVSWTTPQIQQMLLDQESAANEGAVYGYYGIADTLVAGLGDKLLDGQGGADTYVYSSAGGNDVVVGETEGTLQFTDIASTGVTLSRPNGANDLVLTVNSTGNTVTVRNELYFTGGGALAAITFADGVSWTTPQIHQMLLDQESATNGGAVYGYYGVADTLVAGLGDKLLDGQGGADTYVYSSAGGNDVVVGETEGTLQFTDIASTDVTLSHPNGGNDLVLTVNSTGKTVTVDGEFGSGSLNAITFSDGVSWSLPQVEQMLLEQESAASSGTVYGFSGNDTLIAGLGDKVLNGEGGADTYVYSSAGGNDVVVGESQSKLQFTDIASTDVALSRTNSVGGDLIITVINTGKTVTVQNEFDDGEALAAITFSDGVSLSLNQIEDILNGNPSSGPQGYMFNLGDGHVTLDQSTLAANSDAIQMGPGISAADLIFQADGSGNLTVSLRNSDDSITIDGDLSRQSWGVSSVLAQIEFSDGTSMNVGQPSGGQGSPLSFTWFGNADNYYLTGSNFGSNQFDITAENGNVVFGNSSQGGSGANVVEYAEGDGRLGISLNGGSGTLQMGGAGLTANDVYLEANGFGDLSIGIVGDSADSIAVNSDLTNSNGTVSSGINAIQFGDGTLLNLEQTPLTFTWFGNAGNYLTGSNFGSNLFDITTSNVNVVFGNSSQGGDGANIVQYAEGDGRLNVSLNGGAGTLQIGSGLTASDVYVQANGFGDLTVGIVGDSADSIAVNGDLSNSNGTVSSGISAIQFGDGTSLNLEQTPLTFTWFGNAGNYLTGSNFGSNLFDITSSNVNVGFGNSTQGGDGANIVQYAEGDGRLDVSLNSGTGTIQIGSGLTASDVYVQANSSGDLIVGILGDTADNIVVHNDLANSNGTVSSGISVIQFSDGTSLNLEQNPLTFTWLGNAGNYLTGSNFGSNLFDITSSNVNVGFGNSTQGGNGANIVKYAEGDGRLDVSLNGGTGTLQMGSGLTASDIYVQANSFGDLIVGILGDTADNIVVHNDLANSNGTVSSGISAIQFSDGTSLNLEQNPLTFTWLGNAGNYYLAGSDFGSNLFDITAANGNISFGNSSQGGNGTNVVEYGEGDGRLDASPNGGTGTIQISSGLTASDVNLQSNGYGDLIVSIVGDTNDSIIVHNDFANSAGVETSSISQIQFSDGTSLSPLSLFAANPIVTLTNLSEASDVAEQTIAGIVTSGGTAIVVGQTVTLTDNGNTLGTATVQSNGYFSAAVTLPNQGSNSILATVTDSYGNTGSSSVAVDTLDNVVPTVTITSTAEASNTATQTITGAVASGGAAMVAGQTVTLTDNGATLGTAVVQSNGSFSASVTLPNQGTNSIVATVTDSYGNAGSSSAVVDTLDSIAPTVTITSSTEASKTAAQTITGTVASGGTAVVAGQTVTLTDNGSTLGTAVVQSNGSFSASVTLPNQGTNSIIATVTDSYGNAGSSSAVVDTLDNVAPTVTISSAPAAGNVAAQTITGTVASGGAAMVAGRTVTLTDNGSTLGTAVVQSNGSFSALVTLPNQGTNSIVATVTDSYGNAGSSSALVDTLDNIAPTVAITSTAEASKTAAQTITGTVASSGAAVVAGQTVTLTDNGSTLGTAVVQSNGSFSASLTLPNQGSNSIVATVTDSYGNIGSSAVVVDTLDSVAPTVRITSAAEGSTVAAQTITGTVASGGAAVVVGQTVTLTDNGKALGTAVVQSNGSFSASVTLPNQGSNSIVATVTDSYGNTGASAAVVDMLGVAPTVKITTASEASKTASQTIAGTVTSTDAVVAGQTVTLTDNGTTLGTAIVQSNGSFSAAVTLPNQGSNSIVATVTDSLGLTGSSTAVIDTLDTIAPTVTISSASEASKTAAQTITGTVASGGAAIVVGQTVTLTDNGATLGTAKVATNGTFSVAVTLPNQGSNSILATVTDSYGNTGSSSALIDTLDNVAPTVSITSAAEVGNLAAQSITGTVASGGTAVVAGQTVTLTDNGKTLGTTTVAANGSFTASVTLPNQGSNSILATVTDSYGNIGNSTAVVDTLDTVAPTVKITSAAEASNSAAQIITGTVASGGAAVVVGQTVTLTDNGATLGTAVVQSNGAFTASVTLPNQGSNSVLATVTDSYGNVGSSTAVVDKLDNIAPAIAITSAVESSKTAAQTITGTVASGGTAVVVGKIVTLTDNGATLGTATVQSNGSFSASVTLSNQGSNSIVATVTDSYGNTGNSSALVDTLDNVAPTVTITGPAEASNTASQTITGTVASGGTAVVVGQTVTLTDNGKTLGTTTVQSDGSFSVAVTLPNQGSNSILATVTDSYGNVGSSTAVVDTLDTIAPTVKITSGAEGSNTAAQSISGTVASGGAAAVVGQTVTLTDNGTTLGTATVQSNGSFTTSVTLPNQGNNSIVAVLTDSFGNTGSSTAVVDKLDTVAPTVTISSAAEQSKTATQTIAGTVTSGGTAIVVGETVTLTDNGATLGTATVQSSGSFSAVLTLLNQGSNAILATVTDSYGNTGSSTALVDTLDNVAPTVTITSAAEAGNSAVQAITGTVVSGGTAIVAGQTVTLTDNGKTLGTTTVQSNGSFATSIALPNQGSNSIVATVTDGYGNIGNSAAVVDTLDNIAPTVKITSAAQASNTAAQIIAGTVTSGGTAAVIGQTVTLTDNGATLGTTTVQSNGTFSASVTLPNEGSNSIVAVVSDSYGNTSSSTAVVDKLDNIAPTVTITSAAEASKTAAQTISGTVVSGGTAIVAGQTITLTDNGTTLGTAVVQSNGSFSASVTLLNQGANSIVATVTDSYGNAGSSSAVVDTLDNVAPTVTIGSAAQASNVAAQTISGTVTSGGTAAVVGQTVTLTDNGKTLGTTTVQSNGAFTTSIILPNQGSNSIVATVTDGYGNTGSSAAVVDTLDNVVPTVKITSAAEAGNVAAQTVSGTVASGGAAAVVGQTVTLTDNGATLGTTTVAANGTFSASVTLPNQGSNSILAVLTDSYGNTGSSSALIDTLDNVAPTVTITSATEASKTAAQTIAGKVTSGGAAVVIGETVTLTDNGTTLGNATVQSNGTFSAVLTLLNQGANAIIATVTDSYGNTGNSSALVDTLDNVAPSLMFTNAPLPSDLAAQTVSGSVTSGGTAAVIGQAVTLSDNGKSLGTTTVQSNGTFATSVTLPNQANNEILASVTDSYGNTNNTYLAANGSGQTAITAGGTAGTTNDLDFTGSLTDQNLWFVQSGNNLQIDILGTNNSVTVNNWFSGGSNQLQEIMAGGLKIDNQVSQLVQAMATYSANNSGFNPTSPTITAAPNNASLQNSIAAAWHS